MKYRFSKNQVNLKDNDACWCGSHKHYADCHKNEDIKLDEYSRAGFRIPNKKLIKNEEQIIGCREAGKINSMILDKVEEKICVGMTTQDIDDIVSSYTKELGGIAATLNYEGYPKSVCTSINNVVCHGIPSKNIVLKDGDIINVDCTTIFDGYFGDASRMFLLGNVSQNAKKLIDTTKEAVDIAISHLYPYCHLGDIGYYINTHCRKSGFSVVRDIGGHGVGLKMHEDPYVCHIGELGKGMILAPGMIFTIEPMVNEGRGDFIVDNKDGWTVYTTDGKLSAQVEKEILITDTGYEILSW